MEFEGGRGGGNPSTETRGRMRLAQIGKKQSPETIEKRQRVMRVTPRASSWGANISKAKRGKGSPSEAQRARLREVNLGKKHSVEAIAKKVEKTAKSYLIRFPDGEARVVKNLVNFCRERALSISGIRDTLTSPDRRRPYRGYWILSRVPNG